MTEEELDLVETGDLVDALERRCDCLALSAMWKRGSGFDHTHHISGDTEKACYAIELLRKHFWELVDERRGERALEGGIVSTDTRIVDAEYHGRLSLRIVSLCRELSIGRFMAEPYEIAPNGEAVATACADLLVVASALSNREEVALQANDLCSALRERLALLGRDADRAARIAYPDPFAEHTGAK